MRSVSYQSRVYGSLCVSIPLSLEGNGSVNTFSPQQRIVGGVVFYAVCVASKENRQIVQTRTSCIMMISLSASVKHIKCHINVWKVIRKANREAMIHYKAVILDAFIFKIICNCSQDQNFFERFIDVFEYTHVTSEGRVSVIFHGTEINCSSFSAHCQRVLSY
jgi:hypothetical protein